MRSIRATCALLCVGLATLTGGCSLATAVDRDEIPEDTPQGIVKGSLGGYQGGHVYGWAMITGQDSPVQVRIEVDGSTVATVTASTMRQDLVDKNIHPTGQAGFSADVGALTSGASVGAFVGDKALTNSPITVP